MLEKAKAIFGADFVELLLRIGELAGKRGLPAYLVGGAVRDLALEIRSNDIDIMLEGDAVDFVQRLAVDWQSLMPNYRGQVKRVVYPRYGTGKLLFEVEIAPGIGSLDFSTARSERYSSPGAKPEILPGDLYSDLARRDFTINALALSLTHGNAGEVFDYFESRKDIDLKSLAVLHDLSFIDDPARLIRAVRFKTRLGFSFSDRTAELFKQAVSAEMLKNITSSRLAEEYKKVLAENQATEIKEELRRLDVLPQIERLIRLQDA